MVRLRWLPEAVADVERLRDFLKEKSPAAAARVARLIVEGSRRLRQFTMLGRPDEHGESHDLILPYGAGAYVLRYRIDGGADIVILRVWFSREDRTPLGS